MNLKNKAIWLIAMLLVVLTFVTGCSEEQTPYELNDAEGFTVSVRYDANGGMFTTNTSVIVDSYNVSQLQTDSDGQAQIALLSPDNAARGNDAFEAVYNGHFLAGWYTERIESTDSEGNTVYTYSGRWDFEEDLLKVDPQETHTSAEPVITLYAAWVPLFEVEFYSIDSGEYLESYTYNPMTADGVKVPAWNEETGAIEMYHFPAVSGYTFFAAYYDEAGSQPVEDAYVDHPGDVDYATGTAENTVMQVYIDWTEGEWYHIYNVEQFLDNASVSGNYAIHADLDFDGQIWPTSLMYGNFTGSIEGNGHTFSNITLEQTNNSKTNAGLFGYLAEEAEISDLTLNNVTFTIKSGTRVAGTTYGLLAGSISDGAEIDDLTITSGTVQIDSGCYFGVDDYSIGLLCGMGSADVDISGISCTAVGDNPESVAITVDGNDVSVEFITE